MACGILVPQQNIKPASPSLAAQSLITTGSPGKSLQDTLICILSDCSLNHTVMWALLYSPVLNEETEAYRDYLTAKLLT